MKKRNIYKFKQNFISGLVTRNFFQTNSNLKTSSLNLFYLKNQMQPVSATPQKTESNLQANRLINQSFDKGRMKLFVLWFLKKYGERKTLKLLDELKTIGFGFATKAGTSIGIEDLQIPASKSVLIGESEKLVYYTKSQSKRGDITEVEKFQRMIDSWHQTSETLKNDVVKNFEKKDLLNPVYMMAFSGARGNLSQVRQLVGMRGLMSDPQGRIIDFPIRSNFREGLTLTEYVISTYGARKGIVDTALRTANAGYLTRRLVDVAQHVIVSNFDCGTKRGIVVTEMKEGLKTLYSLPNRLLGRVLASDIIIKDRKIASRNDEIFQELAVEISKNTSKVFIRSPLTCETRRLVCQLCYGWTLGQGTLVSIGEAVGIIAAQSIGEPGTQLTMRTFHTGGVFSGDLTEEVLAFEDGKVTYSAAIPGTLIRTPQGKIAFLTKNEGQLNFTGKTIKKHYKLPPFSILYARNEQNVFKKELIAQISTKIEQKQQKEDVEQKIVSELEGVFYNGHVDLLEKINAYSDPIFEAQEWGYVWILSGKIYQLPVAMPFYPQSGDFVTPNSIMSQVQWKLTNKGKIDFMESNLFPESNSKIKASVFFDKMKTMNATLPNKNITKSSFLKKNFFLSRTKEKSLVQNPTNVNSPLIIEAPIFSVLLKSIQFKSIGYVLSALESFETKRVCKNDFQKSMKNQTFTPLKGQPTEKFFVETSLINKKDSLTFKIEKNSMSTSQNSLIHDTQKAFSTIKNTDEWRRNPTSVIQWFPQNLKIRKSGLIKFENLQVMDSKTKQLTFPTIVRYIRLSGIQVTKLKNLNFNEELSQLNSGHLLRKFYSKNEQISPHVNSFLSTQNSYIHLTEMHQKPILKSETNLIGSIFVIPQKFLTMQKISFPKDFTNLIYLSYKKSWSKKIFEQLEQKDEICNQNLIHKLTTQLSRKKETALLPLKQVITMNAQGNKSIFSKMSHIEIGWFNPTISSSKISFFPIKKEMQKNPNLIQSKRISKFGTQRAPVSYFVENKKSQNDQSCNYEHFVLKNIILNSVGKIQNSSTKDSSKLSGKIKKVFNLKQNNSSEPNVLFLSNPQSNKRKNNNGTLTHSLIPKIRFSLIITKKENSTQMFIRFKQSSFSALTKETRPLFINHGWVYCSFESNQLFKVAKLHFSKKNSSHSKGKQVLNDLIFDHNQISIIPLKMTTFNELKSGKQNISANGETQNDLTVKLSLFNPFLSTKRQLTSNLTNSNRSLHWIKNEKSRYYVSDKNYRNGMSMCLIQIIDEKIVENSQIQKRQLTRFQINSKQKRIQNFEICFNQVRQKFHTNEFNKQIPISKVLSSNPPATLTLNQNFQFPVLNFLTNTKLKEQKMVKAALNDTNRFSLLTKEVTGLQSFKWAETESQNLEFLESQTGKKFLEFLKKSGFFTVKKELNFSYFIIGLLNDQNIHSDNFGNDTLKLDFNLKSQFRLRKLFTVVKQMEEILVKKKALLNSTVSKDSVKLQKIEKNNLVESTLIKNSFQLTGYSFIKGLVRNLSISSGFPVLTISTIHKKSFFLKSYKEQIRTKNTFLLNSTNTIIPTSNFAKTGFLSSHTGEVLNINQYFWTNRLNKNRSLILTKSDLVGFGIKSYDFTNNNEKMFMDSSQVTSKQNLGKIFSQNFLTKKPIFIKVDAKLFKVTDIQVGAVESKVKLKVGEFFVCGDRLDPDTGISQSGQIIHVNRSQITLRKGQPIFVSPKGILNNYSGDFIEKNKHIITLPYQRLKTGDIIQGIPKVEQFFEARTTKAGKLFRDSIPNLLKGLFKHYKKKLPLQKAVRQSLYKTQQILVDGVQRVYRSQGVSISDKHIEVIVKQMTSKVRILNGGQTGFFPGEILDLDFVEEINRILLRKIQYEPLILGITRASLEVDSFLAAASFQQTTKMLSRAALYRKKDFLKGLKENVILGNLIPAGTGYLVSIDFPIKKSN